MEIISLGFVTGGAGGSRFDSADYVDTGFSHGRIYSAEGMWKNYCYYMERLLPVAERARVILALHQDDPPVQSLGGIARIFRDFSGFDRAMKKFDSPFHGLYFCMGCWSEMGPSGVIDAIHYFGDQGKIVYVHFRDVQREIPCFNECFIDEGNLDTFAIVKKLREVRFKGFMIADHVPRMVDDTIWEHGGRAYAIGYIRALIDVANCGI